MVSHPRRDEPTSDTSSNSSTRVVEEASKRASSPLFRRHRMKLSQFFRNRPVVDEESRERVNVEDDSANRNSGLVDQTTIVIHPSPDLPLQEDTSIDATMELDDNTANYDDMDRFSRSEPSLALVDPIGTSLCALPYLEQICGMDTRRVKDHVRRLNSLPDDPTVQESIECVVTAQQDLYSRDRADETSESAIETTDSLLDNLQTPSSLQQCYLKNRCVSRLPPQLQRDVMSRSPRRRSLPPRFCDLELESPPIKSSKSILVSTSKELEESAPTLKPVTPDAVVTKESTLENAVCTCCDRHRPVLDPEEWPQRPLLLRPTPNGGTVVKGIRFSSSKEYLWSADPGQPTSELTWPEALQRHWDGAASAARPRGRMCPKCMVLPINNGKELVGESLVTDFESDLFQGSMLVRLKDCQGTTRPGREQVNGGYFHGLHRRYQVVIQGKFKQAVPWTELVAGFQ